MKRIRVLAPALFLLLPGAPSQPAAEPLRLVQTAPLPGVEGRIDHLAVDAAGKRIFIAALGNNTLEVVDAAAGKWLRRVTGLREPQGVAYAPDLRRLFVGCGEGASCEFIDSETLKRLRAAGQLEDADNVRYDAPAHRVYVGYGRGALAALDPETGKKLGEVKLAVHPESFQLERLGPRIFVNLPGARRIAVVDRRSLKVTGTWPLTRAEANYPMALDEADGRLFVGCRRSPGILVLETQGGREIASLPIAGDTDDLFYDAARKRLYAICGEGTISIISRKDRDHYEPLTRVATAPGARTGLFAPDLDRLFVAVPHRGAQRCELRAYAPQ